MQKLFILYFIFFLPLQLFAQDTLPKISVINISNNILISWTNPFVTLTTINIQRSFDSSKNFSTIGSVLDVANKTNGLIDAKPVSANMYYRLFLSFEGGTYIFTKPYRPVKDTTKVLPDIKEFQQSAVNTWFVSSRFVYTGKDNNIIISLPGVPKKKYYIKFFEENGALVFELNKITEPYLTIEKVNFIHAGIFDFELYENGVLIEKHKIYIPKDVKLPLNINEQGKNPSK
jgi:hypothetical protein